MSPKGERNEPHSTDRIYTKRDTVQKNKEGRLKAAMSITIKKFTFETQSRHLFETETGTLGLEEAIMLKKEPSHFNELYEDM